MCVDTRYVRPAEVDLLVGDSTKAQQLLNWKHKTSFKMLVKEMVMHDMKLLGTKA